MTKSGKTPKTGEPEAFDFPLFTKKSIRVERRGWVLLDSENLHAKLLQLHDKINWDALRQASTEDEVNASLSQIDQFTRERLPNAAAILATVRDPNYPKLRPIRFLARSCALARTFPTRCDSYSPRYSRDICYRERKRRGPPPKPIPNLEYWQGQAELGQRVPRRYLRRINKRQAEKEARAKAQEIW